MKKASLKSMAAALAGSALAVSSITVLPVSAVYDGGTDGMNYGISVQAEGPPGPPLELDEFNRYIVDDFADGTDAWHYGANTSISAEKGVLRVFDRADKNSGPTRVLSRETFFAGESYSFSADVRRPDMEQGEFVLLLFYYDADMKVQTAEIARASAEYGEWAQLVNNNFTIPEGANSPNLKIVMDNSKAEFEIDDVQVGLPGVFAVRGENDRRGRTPEGMDWFCYAYGSGDDGFQVDEGTAGSYVCAWNSGQDFMGAYGSKFERPISTKGLKCEFELTVNAEGNTWLEIYGTFKEPNVEFHICEDYSELPVPESEFIKKGQAEIDGAVYDIYMSKPKMTTSPDGMPTIIWSVRSEDAKRTYGTVDISAHIGKWAELCGLNPKGVSGAFVAVEGWNSSGMAVLRDYELTGAVELDPLDFPEYPDVIKGDLNLDGKVDAFDLILEKQEVIAGVHGARSADAAADIDSDGKIGVNDLVLLTKYLLGEIDKL